VKHVLLASRARLPEEYTGAAPSDYRAGRQGVETMPKPKSTADTGRRGAPTDPSAIERPVPSHANSTFGSDAVADSLRALDIPYVALTPGSSFRGLHDSLVNHLGNERPQMLVCLHEEHAVAIAHGYAKVTGRPMAAAVHANVGLLHAAMAIFNAWCDRQPVIVVGATGPVDAEKRRPWIDWIHTAGDQGSLVRNYVKWDDQPASPGAARQALLRAAWIAETAPKGPVYVNLDVGMQEAPLAEPLPPITAERFMPAAAPSAPASIIGKAAEILAAAERPVILMGRVSRSVAAWEARVALAERLGARVVTDLKIGASFPTDHSLHVPSPAVFPEAPAIEAVSHADVVLSLDWVDLAGILKACFGSEAPSPTVMQVSLDHYLHNGWSMDHQALPPVDLFLAADPDTVVPDLLRALDVGDEPVPQTARPASPSEAPELLGTIDVDTLGTALLGACRGRDVSLLHVPLQWNGDAWPFRHPLDFIGTWGGGGIGGGPGISIGAALALRGSGRLPVAILGDGDFLMGATALWTAAHYHIPLLIVVANNRSYFNDEIHQERVARARGRPVENRWIGQRMSDPELDLCAIARGQGAFATGPVHEAERLATAFAEAIAAVDRGAVAVVDVRVERPR
jgi:thiamine pyrophosphate-dependent acetolactate synthase large subunit-like protein